MCCPTVPSSFCFLTFITDNLKQTQLDSLQFRETNKAAHDKTNKMACLPSEDTDQPSLISLHCALIGELRTQAFFMRIAKTDQTGRMPRLIESSLGAHAILSVLT